MNTTDKIVAVLDLLVTAVLVPMALYGLITGGAPIIACVVWLVVGAITGYWGGKKAGAWWAVSRSER